MNILVKINLKHFEFAGLVIRFTSEARCGTVHSLPAYHHLLDYCDKIN
jgi:hypothetical protein